MKLKMHEIHFSAALDLAGANDAPHILYSQSVLGMILLNCIMILILITYRNMYHDTDT